MDPRPLKFWAICAAVVLIATQVWYWADWSVSDLVNSLIFLVSVASALALIALGVLAVLRRGPRFRAR